MRSFLAKRLFVAMPIVIIGVIIGATENVIAQEAIKPKKEEIQPEKEANSKRKIESEKTAKNTSDAEEDVGVDTLQLETMVVTAGKDEKGKKNIESKALKTHKVVDLAEILSDEIIEASMVRKGGYGNEVVIRGFSQANLRTTIDGGLLEGACGSRKDPSLSHINMLTVDSIAIMEGPFDVTVPGSLGGSIDVTTKKPREGIHGELISKCGSYGFLSNGASVTGGNEYFQALFGYNYSQSRQYKDGDGNRLRSVAPMGRPYNHEGRHMNAFEKQDFWLKLQITPSEDHTILLEHTYGAADDIMAPRVGMDIDSEKTYLEKISYAIDNLGGFSDRLTLSAYQNKVKHNPSDRYRILVGAPSFHRHNDVVSTIAGGSIENVKSTDFAEFTCGFDAYTRDWDGDMYRDDTGEKMTDLIPNVHTLNLGAYIKAEKDISRLSLEGGFRAERFVTKGKDELTQSSLVTSTNRNHEWLPTGYLCAKYYLTEDRQTNIFGGIGRSVRTPTSVESYLQSPSPYFHGNPDLDPTKNTEFDLGFQHKPIEMLTFRAKGFYSILDDYIYQKGKMTADSHKTWTNIDAHLYGCDVKINVDIPSDFSVEGGAAWQKATKDSWPDANNHDKNLAQIPPLKTRLALNYDNSELLGNEDSKLFGTLEWIHSNCANHADEDAGEQRLDSWSVTNLRIRYQYKLLGICLGCDNIFNECYAVANSYEWDVVSGSGANPAIVNEPGRFFYVSVDFRF